MATKEAVFNLKVNTGDSVKEVQDLDKSLDNLNESLDESAKAIDKNSTFAKRYGDELQPLTTRLGEAEDRLYELALAGDTTSKEYQELLETVTRYRKTQISVDKVVDASSRTMSEKLVSSVNLGVGAFTAFESALALAGVENEELVQTMVKLQALQGLSGSIQSMAEGMREMGLATKLASFFQGIYSSVVGTSTGALKLFRIALASTGIGLLIIGLAMLITNWKEVNKWIDKTMDSFGKFKPVVKILTFAFMPLIEAISSVNYLLKELGFIESDEEIADKKRWEEKKKRLEEEKQAREDIFNAEQRNYDRRIALLEAEGKATFELTQEKIQASIEYQKQIRNELLLAKVNLLTLQQQGGILAEASKEQLKEVQKQLDASRESIAESENQLKINVLKNNKEKSDSYQQYLEKRKQQQEEQFKIEQDRLWKIQALENEFLDELEALDEEHYQKTLTAQQKEETAVNDKYFRLIETAKQYGMDTIDLEAKQQIELATIRDKYEAEELKKRQETEQKKLDLIRKFQSIVLDEFENERLDFENEQKQQVISLNEALNEGLITQKDYLDAQNLLEQQYADKLVEINKRKNEYIKEQEIKAREEQLKSVTDLLSNAQKGLDGLNQINALVNEIDQARLNTIQNQRDENLENLDRNLKAQLNSENLTAEQKTQIEQNFAQQKFAVQQKAFEEEEKIKRAQFNRDKALKLAQVSIDTASAIVKAIAQFGPPPSPLGIAGITSAGIIGLTQALAILNQQYQGGTAPTPPQISGGGNAGSLAGAGASTFTANTTAEQTDLTTLGQENVPISQVVVLESDITGTQSKVAVQEAKSSF